MATITITIPDSVLPRVTDAISGSFGYTGAGGQTKGQFTKQWMIDTIKKVTRDFEANRDASIAALAAAAKVDSEIVLS